MASLNQLNPFKNIKPIKRFKKLVEHSPIEAITHEPSGIIKGVIDSAKNDLLKATTTEMWKELLAAKKSSKKGDMHAGQEIDLSTHHDQNDAQATEAKDHSEKAKYADMDPGINYKREILHYREQTTSKETREVHYKVEEIIIELKRLIDSSTVISAEFRQIAVTQAPAEVGKYHINFYEWMLNVVKDARMKVEDSGAWLGAMKGKGGKKDYWSQFKKHGTSFGMSNERSVATQTG